MGRNTNQVRNVAAYLIHIVRTLELSTLRMVEPAEIDQAGNRWIAYRGPERLHIHSKASPTIFITLARQWLRFHGSLILPARRNGGFEVQLAEFRSSLESRKLAVPTVSGYIDRTRRFLLWISERHSHLSLVSVKEIDDFLASRREAGWRPMTLAGQCQALRSFFRYAEERGWCAPGIWRGILSPRVTMYTEAPKGPSWAVVRRLIRSVNGKTPEQLRARAILLLFSVYGLRVSEVARLRLNDFDWRNETFWVHRAKRGGLRQFPIQYEVGEAILNYLRYGRAHCACRHVFLTLMLPSRPLSPEAMTHIVGKRLTRMNVPSEHRGPHSLRHACATQLLKKGSSLKEIADFLGHRNTQCVAIYAQYDKRSLRNVAAFSLARIL